LVAVPGASAVIQASFVTYANDAKVRYAHVPQNLLDEHGAVSEEVAVAMAKGVREETKHCWTLRWKQRETGWSCLYLC